MSTGIVTTELPHTEERTKARGEMVSVLVLVTERPEPLAGLYEEFSAPLTASGRSVEFIFIAGAQFESILKPVLELTRAGKPVRALSVGQDLTEAGLLQCALDHCQGDVVLTLPAYRRVNAESLPALLDRVDAGADVAVARRWPRRDSIINRLQNRAVHSLLANTAGGNMHDLGCGVRAARRDVLRSLPVYGDFSRFLPLIAWREGYAVEEVDVAQHDADRTIRIYSPGIYLRRLIDIFGLYFLVRFREKPLRFFGLIGAVLAGTGAATLAVLTVQRFGGRGLSDRPLLLAAVLLVVLGVQVFALGLVGEIIVHLNAAQGRRYRVKSDAIAFD